MMTRAALLLVALFGLQDPTQELFDGVPIRQDLLLKKDGSPAGLMIRQPQAPLPKAKVGPKVLEGGLRPEYDYITWGYIQTPGQDQHEIRFRVYSQERKAENDTAIQVARTMLRLWDLNRERLKIDHPRAHHYQMVDLYLTYGGKAGGEQFVKSEVVLGAQRVFNNIFIYDIASFNEPVEMLRELAHEYGHATIPAVGTYRAPEAWANGFLGERLYMMWIRDLLAAGQLLPEDFMGVDPGRLNAWVASHVDAKIDAAAANQPTMGALADRSEKGFEAYVGLATYMGAILPHNVFGRSLKLIGSQDARDYLQAIAVALEEQPEVPLNLPARLRGKPIWVPVGKGRVVGAKVLSLNSGWARIQPGDAPVFVKSRP